MAPPPSLIARILIWILIYWSQRHPLCQCNFSYKYTSPVSEYPLLWVNYLLRTSSKSRPTVVSPSCPSPAGGNPRGTPPAFWTLPPTTSRSKPQIVTPPAMIPNKTLLTLTDLPPPSVVAFLTGPRLSATYWYSDGPPASCRSTGLAATPDTWISPRPLCTTTRHPPWDWRTPPCIGLRSRRPSSATSSACSCCIS